MSVSYPPGSIPYSADQQCGSGSTTLHTALLFLCPFAVYYLRYAVRSFFTMSRIYLADSKRAGQKVDRKIAVAVQNVKTTLLFVPLF